MSGEAPGAGPRGVPRHAGSRPWITSGSILSAAWRLSLPMMAAMILQNLLSIVDMIFVGRLGPAAIAAVGMGGTVLGVVHMLAVGIVTGSTALVAQSSGAGDRARAGKVASQSLLMAVVLSGVVAALGVPLAGECLRALGAGEDVVAAGRPYLQITTGGCLAMLLSSVFGGVLRGSGDAVTPLKVIALANVINLVLDPILIFGWLGMPALGVAGSAWATVIARLVAASVLAGLFFVRGHEGFLLRLRDLRPETSTIARLLRIGVFGSGQMLMINLSSLALVRIVAVFGTAPLAAYGVGMRLQMVAMMPGMGFGAAAATLVGQNVGAGRHDRAERSGWLTAAMYAVVAVVLSVAFYCLAEPLIAVFNSDSEVVTTGAGFLRWFAAGFVFMAFGLVLGRAMHGAGDTFWPMTLTGVGTLLLRIPLAYVLARSLESVTGIWIAVATTNVIQGLLFAAAFRVGHWKTVGMRISRGLVESASAR